MHECGCRFPPLVHEEVTKYTAVSEAREDLNRLAETSEVGFQRKCFEMICLKGDWEDAQDIVGFHWDLPLKSSA